MARIIFAALILKAWFYDNKTGRIVVSNVACPLKICGQGRGKKMFVLGSDIAAGGASVAGPGATLLARTASVARAHGGLLSAHIRLGNVSVVGEAHDRVRLVDVFRIGV
jgi:hypothetical protein